MERRVRLGTGLVLFSYATCHFTCHATGLFGLGVMDAVRTVLLAPWRSWAGLSLLLGSLLMHGWLGLWALYRAAASADSACLRRGSSGSGC